MRVEGSRQSGYQAEGTATEENVKLMPPAPENGEEKALAGAKLAEQKEISQTELQDKIEQLNKAAEALDRKFKFQVHEATHRIMIQVLSKDTEEVIAEYPPRKILDVLAKINEEMGLLVDAKV